MKKPGDTARLILERQQNRPNDYKGKRQDRTGGRINKQLVKRLMKKKVFYKVAGTAAALLVAFSVLAPHMTLTINNPYSDDNEKNDKITTSQVINNTPSVPGGNNIQKDDILEFKTNEEKYNEAIG